MPQFIIASDTLSYNIMMKFCCRIGKKKILFVLKMVFHLGIPFCVTALEPFVSAYVEFGDLEIAKKLFQIMRKQMRDICWVLRNCSNLEDLNRNESDYDNNNEDEDFVFEKLLPNLVNNSGNEVEYTILMSVYMNVGRVSDTVRMFETTLLLLRHFINDI